MHHPECPFVKDKLFGFFPIRGQELDSHKPGYHDSITPAKSGSGTSPMVRELLHSRETPRYLVEKNGQNFPCRESLYSQIFSAGNIPSVD